MIIYTFSEARQNLSELLKKAEFEGEVMIKRQNGTKFIVMPYSPDHSPLDVDGINVDISRRDIVEAVRKIREL